MYDDSALQIFAQAKRAAWTKDREEVKAAAKKQRRQANEELKAEHEERAKQVTAASLANVSQTGP